MYCKEVYKFEKKAPMVKFKKDISFDNQVKHVLGNVDPVADARVAAESYDLEEPLSPTIDLHLIVKMKNFP